MTPSSDTLDFFKNLSKRMTTYHKNIEKVKRYITTNGLTDGNMISNLVIMCVVWTSHKLNEQLTETDILVILGSEQEMPGVKIMTLEESLIELSLTELMDTLVENY